MSTNPRIPAYCLHKPSGQARVIIRAQHIYLGKFGTPESWEKYHRLVAEQFTKPTPQQANVPPDSAPATLLVKELILLYWQHAQKYYVKNGQPTDEQAGIRAALRFLRRLYASTPVSDFGPLKLKAVRQAMIDADLSRGVINQYINRVRRAFRWAVENELVAVAVYQALAEVAGLARGRSLARETPKVLPVSDEIVEKTLPYLSSTTRAMVELQRLIGARPSEICRIRPIDIDVSGSVWCYEPPTHKMEHEERERRIYLGPKAQEVLQPWLGGAPEAYCFCPQQASTAACERRRRKSTVPKKRKRASKGGLSRKPRDCYDRHSYNRAIRRACDQAGVPRWKPNQLRHSRATEVRRLNGLEASQTVLGHAKANVTELYAERNFELAAKVSQESG